MLDGVPPFLLLATRAGGSVADTEYRQFLRFGGLEPADLIRVRMETAPLVDLLPELDLTRYAGVIVGGSPFTISDPPARKSGVQMRVERELSAVVDEVLRHDIPFLGACFGIGTLGQHRGGVVDTTYGEPVGAVDVVVTADGAADPLLDGIPPRFRAFVGHKEALRAAPPGAVLLASSAACPVQMFRVGRHQYATQFHPELDVPGIVERMHAYQHSGYFPPERLTDLIEQVSAETVPWASKVLANFTARYRS